MRDEGDALDRAASAVAGAQRIAVLTGSGISAAAGVPTFRGENGLWKRHRPEELATPQAFGRDPRLVWEWYQWRRDLVGGCDPTASHRAVARLQRARPGVSVVTQNVDGLHALALHESGTDEVGDGEAGGEILELHGSLFRVRCSRCDWRGSRREAVDASSEESLPRCASCGALLRPDVVWFGESLDGTVLRRAAELARGAEVALVVGTSARVQPAASLPLLTLEGGGVVIEVNPDRTPLSGRVDVRLPVPADEAVPSLVAVALEG